MVSYFSSSLDSFEKMLRESLLFQSLPYIFLNNFNDQVKVLSFSGPHCTKINRFSFVEFNTFLDQQSM